MAVNVTWLGHASFRIQGSVVIYIDPWRISDGRNDGDLVLVSHSHYDHWSSSDVEAVVGPEGRIVGPGDVISSAGHGEVLAPGGEIDLFGVRLKGVPAYNLRKPFHPRKKKWLGFLMDIDGVRLYYAGDTDRIPEMAELDGVDLALLPAGGTYTMNAPAAADAARDIGAVRALPYHWGSIVGREADARKFAERLGPTGLILQAGETTAIDES